MNKIMARICALALLSACSLSVFAKSFTVEDIANTQSVGDAVIAPDGRHIAYRKSVPRTIYKDDDGGVWSELHVVDYLGNSRPFVTGKVNVGHLSWSPNGKKIYFLAKLKGDEYKKLYAIPLNGGESQEVMALEGRSISAYSIYSDGAKIALLAKDPKPKHKKKLDKLGFKAEVYEEDLKYQHLYIADITNKKQKPREIKLKAHVQSAEWGASADVLLVKSSPTPLIDDVLMKSSYSLIEVRKGKTRLAIKTEGKIGEAALSADGQWVAFIGAADINDPSEGRLKVASTKNGKITDLLPDFEGHVETVAWSSENELYYVASVGTETLVNSLNMTNKQTRTLIPAGKLIIKHISLPEKERNIALVASTPAHPNEVYRLDDRTGATRRLSNSNSWLKDRELAKQETIKTKARDGLEFESVLIHPLNEKSGKRYPLVMIIHGGPEGHVTNGWNNSYSRPGQALAAKGYAVLYPNYRGSTGRGVAFSKLGQNDYAGKEFDDIVDAKEHLVKTGLVDRKKVGITGGSYGGYASAWGATKQTEHFAASVMSVGVTDLISKYGTTDIANEMFLVHARSNPWDKWQWYLERSPIYYAKQGRTPLLILHGKSDTRVHPSQSMELYRYMKSHGNVPVRLVFYPGEGHGNKRAAARYDFSLRLMRWMDHYLQGKGGKAPAYDLKHEKRLKQ